MEQTYTLLGNNIIVHYLYVEGARKICCPGKPLHGMRMELDWSGTKIVISGIPDIMAHRGASQVKDDKVSAYEKELDRSGHLTEVILCPFYPHHQWGVVQ